MAALALTGNRLQFRYVLNHGSRPHLAPKATSGPDVSCTGCDALSDTIEHVPPLDGFTCSQGPVGRQLGDTHDETLDEWTTTSALKRVFEASEDICRTLPHLHSRHIFQIAFNFSVRCAPALALVARSKNCTNKTHEARKLCPGARETLRRGIRG